MAASQQTQSLWSTLPVDVERQRYVPGSARLRLPQLERPAISHIVDCAAISHGILFVRITFRFKFNLAKSKQFTCAFCFSFIRESIRWLILENRVDEASDIINRVLRLNHKASEMNWEMEHELVSIASYLQGQVPDEKPSYTFMDCFRTLGLRRTSICMMYIWFSCGIGYYGLFFATAPLVDNLAINVFVNGLLELVPCLLSLIVVPR